MNRQSPQQFNGQPSHLSDSVITRQGSQTSSQFLPYGTQEGHPPPVQKYDEYPPSYLSQINPQFGQDLGPHQNVYKSPIQQIVTQPYGFPSSLPGQFVKKWYFFITNLFLMPGWVTGCFCLFLINPLTLWVRGIFYQLELHQMLSHEHKSRSGSFKGMNVWQS
jgi:hypothetical protein